MIFLETERLILRSLEEKDAEIMYDYRNNPLCSKYQRDQTKELAGIKDLIDRRKNDKISTDSNFMAAVVLKDSDEMIGEIVVMPNDMAITLGYTFSYKYHRKGYAYEALSAFTEMLHRKYPHWDFICFAEPENTPSIKLLKKLGYEDYGYADKINSQVFGKWINDPNNVW